jgi:hypothetical protein
MEEGVVVVGAACDAAHYLGKDAESRQKDAAKAGDEEKEVRESTAITGHDESKARRKSGWKSTGDSAAKVAVG